MGYIRTALHGSFAEIARASLDEMERYMAELDAAEEVILSRSPEEDPDAWAAHEHLETLVNYHALIAIVFAAMAVEAFIYYYAVTRAEFSDSWVSNYLDKLDLLSKWVVIPRLIVGKELQSGGRGLNLLRDLIRARNALVHYKSRDIAALYNQAVQEAGPEDRVYISDLSEATTPAWQDGDQWFCMGPRATEIFRRKWQKLTGNYAQQARRAVQTLEELAKELESIDPDSHACFWLAPNCARPRRMSTAT